MYCVSCVYLFDPSVIASSDYLIYTWRLVNVMIKDCKCVCVLHEWFLDEWSVNVSLSEYLVLSPV